MDGTTSRNLCMTFDEWPDKPEYIVCDQDTKFTAHFEEILKSDGIELKKPRCGRRTRTPTLNAGANRPAKCLDHFIVLGEQHLRYLVREFVEHYNNERPHQNKGNLPLGMEKPPDIEDELGEVVCHERLGESCAHYERRAA